MIELTYSQSESAVLTEFAVRSSVLRSALEKFCEEMALRAESECTEAMRSIPRRVEHAADAAAKAEAYATLFRRLAARCEQFKDV